MSQKGYDPYPENYEILECKRCGFTMKVLKGQRRIFKVRCRNCLGTRFRRIDDGNL